MNGISKYTLRLYQVQAAATSRSVRFPTVTATRASTTKTNDTDQNTRSNNDNSMENLKIALARSALKQVPKHGWTQDAISTAAMEDPRLRISMAGMISPTELVNWFMDDMNQQLRTKKDDGMKSNNGDESNNNLQFEAIKWRLEQVLPFVKSGQWHRGMAMGLSTPVTTQSQLHEFIEIISPDNCGAKYHTALGAIFVSTELHLLTDSSNNYVDTWSFLRSRLNELESHQREYGDVNPGQFLMQLASSAPIPSVQSLANMTNSIPVVAGVAVAQSLLEGAASLLFYQSIRVQPPNFGDQHESTTGTKSSDYESPPSSSTRN